MGWLPKDGSCALLKVNFFSESDSRCRLIPSALLRHLTHDDTPVEVVAIQIIHYLKKLSSQEYFTVLTRKK